MQHKKRVLVINSNIELIHALEEWLHSEGCITRNEQILHLKRDSSIFMKLLNEFKPDAVLYDVSIPYKENWEYFKKIKMLDEVSNLKFIITTTNKRALEKIVGHTNTTEIIGKPFDIEDMVKIIRS